MRPDYVPRLAQVKSSVQFWSCATARVPPADREGSPAFAENFQSAADAEAAVSGLRQELR